MINKQPVMIGDMVRLRTPRTGKEIENLPFGTSHRKIAFMDERTDYEVTDIKQYRPDNRRNSNWKSNWRIYLKDVRSEGTIWSFGEHWILPYADEVTEKVYNVLKGLSV